MASKIKNVKWPARSLYNTVAVLPNGLTGKDYDKIEKLMDELIEKETATRIKKNGNPYDPSDEASIRAEAKAITTAFTKAFPKIKITEHIENATHTPPFARSWSFEAK